MLEPTTCRRPVARLAGRLAIALVAAVSLSACVIDPSLMQGGGGGGGGGGAPAPQVQQQTFGDPMVGGRWLDVCFAHGACREQQAVDAFCRQNGYQQAVGSQARVSAFGHENVRIGDNSVCTSIAGNCHRVISVTCRRTA